MLPLLSDLAGAPERTNQETLDALAARSNLSDDERSQVLPSGKQTVFATALLGLSPTLSALGSSIPHNVVFIESQTSVARYLLAAPYASTSNSWIAFRGLAGSGRPPDNPKNSRYPRILTR